MLTLSISPRFLKAALLFVSSEEYRPILSQVRVEIDAASKKAVITATDGHKMIVIKADDDANHSGDGPFEFCIPGNLIAKMPKVLPGDKLEVTVENNKVTLTGRYHSITGNQVLEAHYPKWRECIPMGEKELLSHLAFRLENLEPFLRASKIMGDEGAIYIVAKKPASPSHSEFHPYAIRAMSDAWFGVLMPLRHNFESLVPEWINQEHDWTKPIGK